MEDDMIELFSIRVYSIDSLVNFFTLRDFKLVDKVITNNKAQILLEKIK